MVCGLQLASKISSTPHANSCSAIFQLQESASARRAPYPFASSSAIPPLQRGSGPKGSGSFVGGLALMTHRWFWVLVFFSDGLASCFAMLASTIHFQILGAVGFFFLMAVCWGFAGGIAVLETSYALPPSSAISRSSVATCAVKRLCNGEHDRGGGAHTRKLSLDTGTLFPDYAALT
jgi:hypothetical protein